MDDHIDIPQSFLERLVADKRKLALVVGGALLVLLLLVFGAVRLFGDSESEPLPVWSDTPNSTGDGSTEETSSSVDETRSTDATEPTDPGTPGGGTGGASGPSFTRKPLIAYRLDGALWVSAEDASNSVKLATVPQGAFSLSPDGAKLAYVDADTFLLQLVDVASGATTQVGPAENADLCWLPDSTALVYTVKTNTRSEVHLVMRDGRGDASKGVGHSPRSTPDALGLAWIADASFGQPGMIATAKLAKGSATATLKEPVAGEVSFGVDGVVAAIGDAPGTARVVTMKHGADLRIEGASAREIVGAPLDTRPVSYAHLCMSPGSSGAAGRHLAYAEVGDDGYSHAFIHDSTTGRSVALTVRRDTYPLFWSADGKRLFFVEGNAFQGEQTNLMSVGADGMGRELVVSGAGL